MTIVNDCQYMKFNQGYEYFDALTPAEKRPFVSAHVKQFRVSPLPRKCLLVVLQAEHNNRKNNDVKQIV